MPFCAAVMAMSVLLVGCRSRNVLEGDADYPKINPVPSRYFLLHGRIDDELAVGYSIVWAATNPSCKYTVYVIEGIDAPYSASQELPIQRNGQEYSVRVPTDGVLPGRCLWKLGEVRVTGSDKSGHKLVVPGGVIVTNTPGLRPGESPDGVLSFACKVPQATDGEFFLGERLGVSLVCYDPTSRAIAVGASTWLYPETRDIAINFHLVTQSEFDHFVIK